MPDPRQFPPEQIDKMMQAVPQLAALGVEVVKIDPARALFRLPYAQSLVAYSDTGVLAGGAIFTLMDSASGTAVFAARETMGPVATLDLRIDYLKPATPGRDVFAATHCYKLTHHVGFVRGAAYHDSEDDPIAHSTGTFMLTHLKEKTR